MLMKSGPILPSVTGKRPAFLKNRSAVNPGVEALDELIKAGEAGTFDFALIDADKVNYDNYYERALTLLRVNGVVAIDNVMWSGTVIDKDVTDPSTEAIRALNKKIHSDTRVSACMMFIGDGMTVARKVS